MAMVATAAAPVTPAVFRNFRRPATGALEPLMVGIEQVLPNTGFPNIESRAAVFAAFP